MTAPRPMPYPRPPDKPTSPSTRPGPSRRLAGRWAAAWERTAPPPKAQPQSWSGALIMMAAFTAVLWVVQLLNAADDYRLDRFGLRPREVSGLWGLLTMPFLHQSYGHVASNTLPVFAIGWVVMLSGPAVWAAVTAIVVVGGGVLTWLVAPSGLVVGASGLVFGWLGYLLARAVFSRKVKWIITAVAVLVFFGSLLFGLFPTLDSDVSWPAHICGFAAGVLAGGLLHPRGGATRLPRRPPVS